MINLNEQTIKILENPDMNKVLIIWIIILVIFVLLVIGIILGKLSSRKKYRKLIKKYKKAASKPSYDQGMNHQDLIALKTAILEAKNGGGVYIDDSTIETIGIVHDYIEAEEIKKPEPKPPRELSARAEIELHGLGYIKKKNNNFILKEDKK